MKGILLAGGLGTRLHPLTFAVGKQLLPIYDKPMIYYPLATLMEADIREVLLIAAPRDLPHFKELFGDGSALGISLSYTAQVNPRGIAEAFIIASSFIGEEGVALILGDNLFYGDHLNALLSKGVNMEEGAHIFGYQVKDPERYGVVAFDDGGEPIDIIEKPKKPPSPYAVTGLYFYDQQVVSIARTLTPSARGELEITDVNRIYLEQNQLRVHLFDSGFAWLDAGTFDSLYEASHYVQTIQKRQGIQIGCIEEVAYRKGWISSERLLHLAERQDSSAYGGYLKGLLEPILY